MQHAPDTKNDRSRMSKKSLTLSKTACSALATSLTASSVSRGGAPPVSAGFGRRDEREVDVPRHERHVEVERREPDRHLHRRRLAVEEGARRREAGLPERAGQG